MKGEKETRGVKAAARRGRLRRYGPVVAWACFVLFASSSNFSASNTSRVIRPLLVWLFPEISEAALAQAHFLVRKAAHVAEYALLALLAARAFRTSRRGALARRWRLASFALVACVALADEYHQSFVPARTGTVYDSLLDIAGGAAALVGASLWLAARGRKWRKSGNTARPADL
ncbi:MAG TPA: VanZ family protein [Pyrinomonadaceae bacterium]